MRREFAFVNASVDVKCNNAKTLVSKTTVSSSENSDAGRALFSTQLVTSKSIAVKFISCYGYLMFALTVLF